MRKAKSLAPIVVITAIMLLLTLCFPFAQTTAWFTSGGNRIECIINVGANFTILQYINGSSTGIDITNTTSLDLSDGGSNPSMLLPDTEYNLKLSLKNSEAANTDLGIRFKIEFFACGATEELLNVEIIGTKLADASSAGYVKKADGYYYYCATSAGTPTTFASETETALMTKFIIPFSDFESKNLSGNNIKMSIIAESIEI